MSLNDHPGPIHSRYPAIFDIEGVPRDRKIRDQKLEEESTMQITRVQSTGTFDFNNPPHVHQPYQEFPRLMYRGAERLVVKDETAKQKALAQGYELKPTAAALVKVAKPRRTPKALEEVAPEVPEEEEQGEDLPIAIEAVAQTTPTPKSSRRKKSA